MRNATKRSRRHRRGFTLVELLIAVAIVGILAAIATVGYRKYMNSAASSEAVAMIQGIRAGEESYKSETLSYLGCSGCGAGGCAPGAGSLTAYYPRAVPNKFAAAWQNPGHADFACWRMLGISADGPVRFGYSVVAGNPGQALPALSSLTTPPAWPATANANPWYVVQAAGDRNGNGIFSIFVASSLTGEVIRQNDWE